MEASQPISASDFPEPVQPATSACGPSETRSSSMGPDCDIPIRTLRTPEDPRAWSGSHPTREGRASRASARVTVHHHWGATGRSSVMHTCAHQDGRRATQDAYPMCTVGLSSSAPRAQCGHDSPALTWMSTPACPSRTGEALFHHTLAPPTCAAICPAHHRAHWVAWSPAIPSAERPGSSDDVERSTR